MSDQELLQLTQSLDDELLAIIGEEDAKPAVKVDVRFLGPLSTRVPIFV
ncbi:MAG: hypothetical protein ACRDGA_09445 [Bacteroidota bacterium]